MAGNLDCKFGFNPDLKISIRILDHSQIKIRIFILKSGLDPYFDFDFGALNLGFLLLGIF